MEDHPKEKEEEKRRPIVITRNEKPQAVEMLTQPTLNPGQTHQEGYKPTKSLLRRADLLPSR